MMNGKPLENPATAQWNISFKHADYIKMLKGFQPQDMDDRWVCRADTPDAHGNTVVHAYRSWTMDEIFALTIIAGNPDQIEGDDWGKITSIAWRQRPGEVSEEEVKEIAVRICKNILHCDLEAA